MFCCSWLHVVDAYLMVVVVGLLHLAVYHVWCSWLCVVRDFLVVVVVGLL